MRANTMAVIAIVPGLLGLAGCGLDGLEGFGRVGKDFHYSYPLQSGGRISVETFNGSVEITGWDQEMVDISGTKYGPSPAAADALPIEITHTPEAVGIRAVRPSDFRGNRGARFLIRIPRKAVVDMVQTSNGGIQLMDGAGPARLRTSNGGIRVEDFAGTVEARTSNGGIHARLAAGGGAPVRLETSNGGVDLELPPQFSDDVRVHTSNGSITLRWPGAVNAHVRADTSNASITTDFQVKTEGELGRHHLDATIGAGGPLVDLSTSNGGIRLLKM